MRYDGFKGEIPLPEELINIKKIVETDDRKTDELLEKDLQEGMDKAAEGYASVRATRASEPLETDLQEGMDKAAEGYDLPSQAREIDKSFEREGGDFAKSIDEERDVAEREIWQHEANLKELIQKRPALQGRLKGLEAQKEEVRHQLYEMQNERGVVSYKEQTALRDEYIAIGKESSALRKELAKVEGEIAERTSLMNSLQKGVDVVGFSREEEAWFDNKESARKELEERKRALQEQLVGSSQFIVDQMGIRDDLMIEKNRTQRKDEEGKKGSWLGKVKMVFKGVGQVRSLDNEIAKMNAEIEASFRKAENLIDGIKALDALLNEGEKARVDTLGTRYQVDDERIVGEQRERLQTMEELAEEMGVKLGEEEEEPMKKAA